MARIHHQKLVRDGIPEKIAASGEAYEVVRLTEDTAFEKALREKVIEEAGELIETSSRALFLSEYADLMIALDALTHHLELSEAELRLALEENLKKKGGFKERFFLQWSEQNKKDN